MHPKIEGNRRLRQIVAGACWLYLAASLLLWIILQTTGDRWWIATVFLFGPRWVCLLPLLFLIPAALLIRRRCLWVLLACLWILLFPVMHLCLPWRFKVPDFHKSPHLRILTCNLHGQNLNVLAALISSAKPDVVAIQEWNNQSQSTLPGQGDYYFIRDGELYLASRYPIRKVEDFNDGHWSVSTSAVCYELDTPYGKIPFINLRLASPHQQLESVRWRSLSAPAEVQDNSSKRLKQSQIISQYAAGLGPTVLLAGDFNTPSGSSILRQCWAGFSDAFSFAGCGFGHTYYSRRVSTRIDYIMAGSSWRCCRCWVGPDVGSAHRPVIGELKLIGADR